MIRSDHHQGILQIALALQCGQQFADDHVCLEYSIIVEVDGALQWGNPRSTFGTIPQCIPDGWLKLARYLIRLPQDVRGHQMELKHRGPAIPVRHPRYVLDQESV